MQRQQVVAPYVGAWIETSMQLRLFSVLLVAPYVGAWIETCVPRLKRQIEVSHPMWVRGLKQNQKQMSRQKKGRTLCGCVD